MYHIGQAFGIFATVCCLVLPLFKKKWQMLAATAVANLCFALNLFLIGQVGSAIIINFVAIVQTIVSLWHVQKEKPVTLVENLIFLILYVACGSLGFRSAIDVLPIIGAVFNMLSTFQRDEQKTRYLILCNASSYFAYYLIVRSTSMFAELIAIITTLFAMYKYRNRKKAS